MGPRKWQARGVPASAQIPGVQILFYFILRGAGVTRGLAMGKAVILIYIPLRPLWLLWADWPGRGMQEATKGAVTGA